MLEFGFESSELNKPGDNNKINVYCHCQNMGLAYQDETNIVKQKPRADLN